MSKLIDMKRTKAERKETKLVPGSAGPYDDDYDYGLRLRLDDDALKKLAMDLPKVGARMTLEARAVVVSVSSNQSVKDKSRNVELQIQKLCIEKGAGSAEEAVADGIEDADK